jgi:hypothetical protein
MRDIEDLTPEQQAGLALAEKIAALARNNDNEHQAAVASAKLMELCERLNLDMAMIGVSKSGAHGNPGMVRKDTKQAGGLYGWQRDLWKAVAKLHFCRYWSIKGLEKGAKYEHRILGSKVNVLSAELMAKYLQQVVEREGQSYANLRGYNSVFVRDAIAYREGMAKRLVERLEEAREERLREDERKKREAEAAARHPGAAPGTALVLADVIQNEDDLNEDYLHGYEPGTTARVRAENAARYQEKTRRRRLWTNDREAFLREFKDDTEAQAEQHHEDKRDQDWQDYLAGKHTDTWGPGMKKSKPRASRAKEPTIRYRKPTAREEREMLSGFREGKRQGDTVNLDRQIDKTKQGKLS